MKYETFSNENLVLAAMKTISTEREATAEVILIFEEIYSRRLYLKMGFPSLFEMATKHFGYCAASAMRRINAMRLIRDVPEAFQKIESGELSLSVVNELQTYFQQEAKAERAYSPTAKEELIGFSLGKSRREVEREIANRNPERQKHETIYAVSNDRSRLNISVSNALLEKINQLRDLRSHANPTMTIEELLEELVELGLKKHDPVRRKKKPKAARPASAPATDSVRDLAPDSQPAPEHEPEHACQREPLPPAEVTRTRYIPVKERPPKEPCCYTDTMTGRRCNSTRFLQLDHVVPFARGGANRRENLRWMCGEHNRARNELVH